MAEIIVHEEELVRGRVSRWFEWRGTGLARVSQFSIFREDDIPSSWKLKLVKRDDQLGMMYYARSDGLSFFSWLYWLVHTKLGSMFLRIYYRFILTLMVWGLAYTEVGCVPSWRDIGKRGV